MIEVIPEWWPNRSNSTFINLVNYNWHIQKLGSEGKKLLLIHGTGASSHSWFPLTEDLELDFEILSLDLPGHGFTKALTKQKKQLKKKDQQITKKANPGPIEILEMIKTKIIEAEDQITKLRIIIQKEVSQKNLQNQS